ncbi:hypothetical protein, partial [Hanstruepera ponticola]|uniref:hypothetical protein n=1 Tax=Hanstruepera ponticola TaxID=2042995 RepID=UPI001CA8BF8D
MIKILNFDYNGGQFDYKRGQQQWWLLHFAMVVIAFCNGGYCILQWWLLHFAMVVIAFCNGGYCILQWW